MAQARQTLSTVALCADAGRGDFYAAVQLVRRHGVQTVTDLIELIAPAKVTPERFDAWADAVRLGMEIEERNNQ